MRIAVISFIVILCLVNSLKIAQTEKSSILRIGHTSDQQKLIPLHHLSSGHIEIEPQHSKDSSETTSLMTKEDVEQPGHVHNSRISITPTVMKLGFYYFLVYLFNVVYNVSNKRVLNVLPLPATMAFLQLLLGIPLFMPFWIAKPPRNLNLLPLKPLLTASIAHALGMLTTTYSLYSGVVSFTHVIKSAEPVFSAALSAIILKNYFAPQVYITLLPIVFGVALASSSELSFTWFNFNMAMISNFFYQLRIVVSKPLLVTAVDGSKLSGGNLFRLLTIISTIFLFPIALYLEGNSILISWNNAAVSRTAVNAIVLDILISGFSFYAYNEISFWILDLVHPITHAVGNTIRRVVLIIASAIIFHIPITIQGSIGSFIAVLGSMLYAIAVSKYHPSK